MSRRGIHPLLMGLDRPQRGVPVKHPEQTSGLESAQRKRYLRLKQGRTHQPRRSLRFRHQLHPVRNSGVVN